MPQHDTPPGPVAPLVSNSTTRSLLLYLHYASPIVLLLFFLTAFTIRSVAASSSPNRNSNDLDTTDHAPTGPGGKPLPKRTPPRTPPKKDPQADDLPRARKLLFEWLSVLVALTFVANAINIIVHALYGRSEQWWCGQSVVVRPDGTPENTNTRLTLPDLPRRLVFRLHPLRHLHN